MVVVAHSKPNTRCFSTSIKTDVKKQRKNSVGCFIFDTFLLTETLIARYDHFSRTETLIPRYFFVSSFHDVKPNIVMAEQAPSSPANWVRGVGRRRRENSSLCSLSRSARSGGKKPRGPTLVL